MCVYGMFLGKHLRWGLEYCIVMGAFRLNWFYHVLKVTLPVQLYNSMGIIILMKMCNACPFWFVCLQLSRSSVVN